MKIAVAIISACMLSFVLHAETQQMSPSAKKLNSTNCAKVLAERNIVETVYGVKMRFSEEVSNLLEGTFLGDVETKTGKRQIKGIDFEPVR